MTQGKNTGKKADGEMKAKKQCVLDGAGGGGRDGQKEKREEKRTQKIKTIF